MTDIAKLAGVSQSTVSLVINHMSGAKVSKVTRETVLRIARELGYPVERHAHPAAAQTRNLIVYLTDELATSPHAMQTIDGAKEAAWEQDCLVAVFATRGDPELEAAVFARMLDHPALLGVIYSTIFTRAVTVPAALDATPTVLLNCHTRDRGRASVVPSELLGGYTATMHLIENGHSRIGFINGEHWIEAAAERLKGYRQALSTADIPFDPVLVRAGDWQVAAGYEHALSLLDLPQRPTALFCANDLMAIGALDAARERKLSVPRDLSVIGYDDQDIARYTHPPLTTVLLPNYEMGRWAADSLIAQCRANPSSKAIIKMECPLVARDSVAPPRL
ncbi:LacI family transcriptional regulator [Massilia sp. Root133]|uniref:LacI family DNA-binding transcriptional regulator n=1 Tax=unclassified Massilia TaxID=2609279 RepID=UPI0006FE7664|nr:MULTISPECIES: LacI family DNA-binding transcriptional regulator [unclassified Massilia]KQY00852.1 LacI family transcriptional regulator [Massilia sp. Root133]KQZ53119.1 LacI family transcriptional regulator [Massilia sp. Root1485]